MITVSKNANPYSVLQRNGKTEGAAFDVVPALKKLISRGKFTALILFKAKTRVASQSEHRKPYLSS